MTAFDALTGLYDAGGYWHVRVLLQRCLAFVYLVAFLVAARQFPALCGEDGLLPLADYRDYWDFSGRPSLFHAYPDDRVVVTAAWTGVGLAALALLGVPSLLGTPVQMAVWLAMWALYLSFVNAGQDFYGFGWESMLLEAGFLAVFLGGFDVAAPAVVVWLFRWLLFRNMLGAGLIKLRGDECWRDLTCMDYHYETQPMPNPLSWYAHHLPDWCQRGAVLTNHVVELLIPFLYFAPQPWATVAGVVTIGFQGWLTLTGNFSWLNLLTAVLAVSTFADATLAPLFGAAPALATPQWFLVLGWTVAALVLLLSIRPTVNMLSSDQVMNTAYDPLHLVNSYGAFGSITRERYELVVQGTDDEPGRDATWETYTFPGKPTRTDRRPPQWAPYHLRLDWHMWFAAMGSIQQHPWLLRLLAKLLRGDEATHDLLREAPFDADDPPSHVRIVRYRYRFTSPAERDETGDWWVREEAGRYYGPVSLDDSRFRIALQQRGWGPAE